MSEKDRLDIMDIGLGKLEKELAELKDKLNSRLIATIDDPRIEKLEIQANALFKLHSNHLINIDKEISELKDTMNICLKNHENLIEGKRIGIAELKKALWNFKRDMANFTEWILNNFKHAPDFNKEAGNKWQLYFLSKLELSGEKKRVISGSFDKSHVEPNKIPLEDEVQSHQHSKPESKDDKIIGVELICPICNQTKYYWFRNGKQLIAEFLKSWDYMMERIEFYTDIPELMDEVDEEYYKWEARRKDE